MTSIIVSLQQYLLDVEVSTQGAWEGHLMDGSKESAQGLAQDKGVRASTRIANLGYARLEESQNEDKPYLFVAGIQNNFTDFSVLTLAEGKMPQDCWGLESPFTVSTVCSSVCGHRTPLWIYRWQ